MYILNNAGRSALSPEKMKMTAKKKKSVNKETMLHIADKLFGPEHAGTKRGNVDLSPMVEFVRTEFTFVNARYLIPHPEQPNHIRLLTGISRLKAALIATGHQGAVTVMPIKGRPGYYWVIDGNRRIEACRQLNVFDIKVEILPANTDIVKIFAWLSGAHEKFGGNATLAAWALAYQNGRGDKFIANIPNQNTANQIAMFLEYVGAKTAVKYALASAKVYPNVVTHVNVILDELVARGQERKSKDRAFIKKLTMWMIDTKSNKTVGDAHNFWNVPSHWNIFDEVMKSFEAGRKYVSLIEPAIHKKKGHYSKNARGRARNATA